MHKKEKIVVLVHILKTGGSTLRSIIKKQYQPEEIAILDFLDKPAIKSEFERRLNHHNIKCVLGHFDFGIHRFSEKQCSYITLLRDPVERVISDYYFIRRSKEHPLYSKVIKMNIEQFVNCEEIQWQISNLQTRVISGSTSRDLMLAQKNLKEHFSIAGITEMFNESLFLMSKQFNWNIQDFKRINVTENRPKRENISAHIIKQIEDKNKFDIELYNFAKRSLNEKIEQLGPLEKKELEKFLIRCQTRG
ncbi:MULTISPECIES: sulfotransferase family 2 domain-containing protein [Bacillaceae]|uniref:sulfotransferase family 2 domain-containing protein n=1 Tax=Bacillaceae TaxID=186817 RepID=UPI000BA5C70E|nr:MULTISPECIES: sulfotransferase family 2 domain-containing protein [Bacillaceae]PAE26349.1 hypothetical protein CHI10_03560 [Bacillus sp. 7894-2]URM31141.1 sulfotransferase family 2 domain-containing protein [Cytobacillus firmus]